MSGGDSHIRVSTSYGTLGIHQVMDASSAKNEKLGMTEAVKIGKEQMFVTPEAAATLKGYTEGPAAAGFRVSAHGDTRQEGLIFKSTVNNLPIRLDTKDKDGGPVRWHEEFQGVEKAEK